MTKVTDYNSIKNQRIKEKFVQREIFTNVSMMVEYIIKKGFEDHDAPFSLEDAENYYVNNEDYIFELENEKEELEAELEKLETSMRDDKMDKMEELGKKIIELKDKIEDLETEQEEPAEIFEWWLITDWLGHKLKEKGEVIIDDVNHRIWGRSCTGQHILLDSVISKICEDLEILEGQKHEWDI